ncbi:MAG: transglutaminase-like domain-containing protein [Bacteroidia bacterium]
MRIKVLTAGFFLLLLVSANVLAQNQLKILNPDDYKRVKKKFPKANYVELSTKKTIYYEEAPKGSKEPFIWRHVEETDRISVSNQRYHFFRLVTNDFMELEKANFWRIDGKKLQVVKRQPEVEMIEQDGVFHANYKMLTFIEPVTLPGEIFRSRLAYKVNSVAHGSLFYFSGDFPAEQSVVEVVVPSWLKIRFEHMNFDGHDIKVQQRNEGKNIVYSYSVKNVDGHKREGMLAGGMHYQPYVVIIPEEMNHPKRGKVRIFKDPSDVYKWNKQMADLTENNPKAIQKLVDDITAGKEGKEKIEAVYYWVQDNIRYLAFLNGLAGFVPDACQNVVEKKYGDCKGTANLLKEMLGLAGFDARLVWIGTRNEKPLSKQVPTIASSNHMIAAVKWEDEWLILDGTSRFMPIDEISDQNQGQEIMIEGKGAEPFIMTKVPELPLTVNTRSNRFDLRLNLESAELMGVQKSHLKGAHRTEFRYYYNSVAQKDREEFLQNYLGSGQSYKGMKNIQFELPKDWKSPIQLEANVMYQNLALVLDDELYLPTMIHQNLKRFQLPEERVGDLTLDRKSFLTDTVVYHIPEGYEVSYLPEKVDVKRGKYFFQADIKTEGRQLHVVRNIGIEDFIIKKQDFDAWNKDIGFMKAFYEDRIILKKQ